MRIFFKPWFETFCYLFSVLFLYYLQFLDWSGAYKDSDNYFHVLRVVEFIKNPTYSEVIFPFTNYPFGEVLHWTRALDIFLVVFSLPFMAFYPLKLAAFYGGLAVAPFFGVLGAYYLLKTGRFFLRWNYRLLAAALILVQVNVMRVIVFERPDHHAAFFFLTAVILFKMVEFIKTQRLKSLDAVAVLAAFSLWMAAEGVFLAASVFLFLMIEYLSERGSYRLCFRFSLIYAVFLSIFLILNPPYEGILFIDTGRLSLFYVITAFVGVLGLYLTERVAQKWCRFAALIAFMAVYVLIIWALGWLQSPLDERIIVPFVQRIDEMAKGNLYTLSYPVVGIILGCFLYPLMKTDGVYLYLMSFLLVFGGLSVFTFHFLPYAGVGAALMMALFVQCFFNRRAFRVLSALGLILLEYISFTIYALSSELKLPPVLVLPMDEILRLPKGTFATDIFFAPDLIWSGKHTVIASPYHRNVEGILDNHQIFYSTDEKEVARLMRKHKVDYVFLTDGLATEKYYQAPEQNCDKLYGKILSSCEVPGWLVLIPTKGGYLYKVDYTKLP